MPDKVAERKHNQAIEARAIEAYIEAGQPQAGVRVRKQGASLGLE
jgi:hypothetical protein